MPVSTKNENYFNAKYKTIRNIKQCETKQENMQTDKQIKIILNKEQCKTVKGDG